MALLHLYACLGEFSTDPLEKSIEKLRQGTGWTYFINAQQVAEKLMINKAKLQLMLKSNFDTSSIMCEHSCELCNYTLDEQVSQIFVQLPNLVISVKYEMKSNLVYITDR